MFFQIFDFNHVYRSRVPEEAGIGIPSPGATWQGSASLQLCKDGKPFGTSLGPTPVPVISVSLAALAGEDEIMGAVVALHSEHSGFHMKEANTL